MVDRVAAAGMRFVGQRVQRKEDPRLLTGRGTYIDDVIVPGMLHAAFVRSPIARGSILSIDAEEARGVSGVVAVLTAADTDALNAFYSNPATDMPDCPYPDTGLLARGDVRFVGDPVALVVAETRALAEDGAALVKVEYAPEAPVVGMEAAAVMPPVHPDRDSNIVSTSVEVFGDIDEAFAAATYVVEDELCNCRQTQLPMETRGLVARRDGSGEVTINLACQSTHMAAMHIAHTLRLPLNEVRVIAKDVGGGFGLKVTQLRDELAVIAAALILNRPVKWIEDRIENLTAASQGRDERIKVRLAFDGDHRLLAADVTLNVDLGAYPNSTTASGFLVSLMFPGPYRLPAYRCASTGWYTNTCGMGPYRGPWMMEMFGRETIMDVAARQMGIDPFELRRKNIIGKPDLPFPMITGPVLDDISPRETFEMVADAIDLPAFRREQAEARKQGRYLGLGIATGIEPTTMGFGIMSSEVAHIRVEITGKVSVMSSTLSQGHGTPTTLAQIAADRLGVPLQDVTIFEGDSSRTGFGTGAGGSRQAVAGGAAVTTAADLLQEKIRRIAAHAYNATADRVRIQDGIITVEGSEEIQATIADIAQMAYVAPDRLPPGMEMGLEAQHRFRAPTFVFANATHACICEVDVETGIVSIRRWIAGGDSGELINPAIVEGQISGGVVQGIAGVLFEHMRYDENGQPLAATLKDYLVPTALDVPVIEFRHMCTPSATPGGFKGVGEGGAMISPPTLVNAVADALAPFECRWLDMPLSPERIVCGLLDEEAPKVSVA